MNTLFGKPCRVRKICMVKQTYQQYISLQCLIFSLPIPFRHFSFRLCLVKSSHLFPLDPYVFRYFTRNFCFCDESENFRLSDLCASNFAFSFDSFLMIESRLFVAEIWEILNFSCLGLCVWVCAWVWRQRNLGTEDFILDNWVLLFLYV